MSSPKSPFYVVRNFISPKVCEHVINHLDLFSPDVTPQGVPLKTSRQNDKLQTLIFDKFKTHVPAIEQYYDVQHRGTEVMSFDMYAEGTPSEVQCDNSSWVKKKWVRTRDRDFSCICFLSDYQDKPPFDNEYEVYGGKLEFPQWNFGFNPERGTLIVYPSSPHFLNAFSSVIAGDLFVVKFNIATMVPFVFNVKNFPGDISSWFSHLT